MSVDFHCLGCQKAKRLNLGFWASTGGIWGAARGSIVNGLVRYFRKRYNRPIFLWGWEYHWREIKTNSSVFFIPKLADNPGDIKFQQDGAPPHYAVSVREYLDQKLGTRWIGRGGPVSWTARSPDLTPCDFFLWSYLKDRVFAIRPNTIAELKTKIRSAIASISEDTLQKVVKNTEFRLRFLLRQRGGHFENLLN